MSSPANHGWISQDEIMIAPESDLTIQIDQYSRQNGDKMLERSALMHVKRDVLVNSSKYFKAMMGSRWAESKRDIIVLEDDTAKSMEIWFRYYHCTLDEITLDDISVADIWHVILASDKYQFDRDELQTWFIGWFRNATAEGIHRDNLANKLMLPCYAFDYAGGFQVLTKSLAYEEKGHIMKVNPIENVRLHLPPSIIQQLNAAKGRLRNVLNRELFAKINSLIENASCGCKDETVFNYLRELGRIKIQPMEEGSFSRVSVQCYLDRLKSFDHERMLRGIAKPRCFSCKFDWSVGVKNAIQVTAKYFDGLCLDCMKTTSKADKEYWNHNNFSERYDDYCRITHWEPTHYFSVMARRDKRGLVAD